jgi:hypothetical protein
LLRREHQATLGSPRGSSLHSAALQHIQTEEPFFSPDRSRTFERLCRAFQKPHPQGLATLSVASALLPSEASFSSPRSWASLFRAFLQPPGPTVVSHGRSAPTLSCQTHRLGNGASAASAHEASCASCSQPMVDQLSGGHALLSFSTSRVVLRWIWEEALSFFLPLPLFFLPTSEEARSRSPRGFLPAALRLPSFEGCTPVWCP